MNEKQFAEQIAAAIQELGAEEAAGCMARSLIYMAHAAENDFEFTCDQGTVSIEHQSLPVSAKH